MKPFIKVIAILGFLLLAAGHAAAQVGAPAPVCTVTQKPANPLLLGTTVTLTANCTNNPTSYSWSIASTNGAVLGTTPSISVIPAQTTTYTLVASNAGGSSQPASDTVQVQVPLPACSITQNPANPVSPGATVTLTANCTNNPLAYSWSAGSIIVGTTPTITVTPSQTTDYTLVASNAGGASQPALDTVQVQGPVPVCSITQSPVNPITIGTVVSLTANCTNNSTAYSWSAGGTTVGSTPTITVTPSQTTAYTLVASNAGGSSQPASDTVQVQAAPPACSITQNPANPVTAGKPVTLTANCNNNPTSYAWAAGGAIFATTNSITVNPTQTVTYALTATGPGGSAQATQTVQVSAISKSIVTAPSVTGAPGSTLPLTAKILDSSNNAVGAGVSVTWNSTDPGDAFLPQATVLTDNTGTASAGLRLSPSQADRRIRACVTGTTVCSADTLIRSIQEAVQKPALQLIGPQAAIAVLAPETQFSNIRARLEELRRSRAPAVAQGLSGSYNGQQLPPMNAFALLPVDKDGKPVPQKGGGASADQDTFEHFGAYINGAVDIGKQSTIAQQTGFSLHSNGVTIGADYRLPGNHVIGAGLGILKASTDLDQSAGTQDAKGYSFSVYGSFVPVEEAYVDVIANIGRNSYDSTRHAIDNVLGSVSDYGSSTHGNQYGISASAGYNFSRGALTLNPYVRAEYIEATVDGFSENGGQNTQGAISVSDQHLKNTLLTVAGQASYAMPLSWGVLVPNARIELQRQAQASAQAITAQLVVDATTNTNVPVLPVDKNFGNYALGFSMVFPHGLGAFFTYERNFGRDNFSDTKYSLGLRAEF